MAKGKRTCKILKEIREQIAKENGIEWVTSECTYKGDCQGTCPKCEAEVRYLERELEKRQRMGKAAMVAGLSLGTLFTTASCDSTQPMTREPLAGDVVAEVVEPQKQEPDTIEERLMGLVAWYQNEFSFDKEFYQKWMKDLFLFSDMEKLSVVSGVLPYGHISDGTECNSLEKLVALTKEFRAPSYPGGEQKMLKDLAEGLKGKPINGQYNGVMELSFTVTPGGDVVDVMVENSLDLNLDAAVIAFLQGTKWHPARYELKDGDVSLFECRCVQKILFPLE